MPFCLQCGAPTTSAIPAGDSRERQVCTACEHIHYENPKLICGALAIWNDQVLLCRRAIEPRHGYWTLPAGFMEVGETTEQGAARETAEEALGQLDTPTLYCLYDVPRIGQVYVLYRAALTDGMFGAGEESLECRLFDEADIPWSELAFPSVKRTLKHYFADRKTGHFPIHHEVISGPDYPPAGPAPTDSTADTPSG